MNFLNITLVTLLTAVLTLIGNLVGYKNGIIESLPGMLILVGICLAGVLIAQLIPVRIPSVAYIVVIGCMITYPAFPGASAINAYVAKVNFLSLTTPILAYSGLGIGKELDSFAKTGWKLILVACAVFVGTFLGSALIAEVVLRMTGQI